MWLIHPKLRRGASLLRILISFSFLFFFLSFSAEARIVGTLSPDILSPHIAKWATVQPPRHHIWESIFVLLVDACWNFFHNVLNLSPNRCHLYIWLSAFPHSYILTLFICPRASTEMYFSLAELMLLFFRCICNVTFFFVLFCVFVFSLLVLHFKWQSI